MKYHNITTDDMLNGPGLRTVLWCSGCEHRCIGCQNSITWNIEDGLSFDNEAMLELMNKLGQPHISGLTLSGGDPLHVDNREKMLEICKMVKQYYKNKTIWIYTGYCYEEIQDLEILKYADVLIDGPFVFSLLDHKAHWVGSTNQRVIDLKKTQANNSIVLWNED